MKRLRRLVARDELTDFNDLFRIQREGQTLCAPLSARTNRVPLPAEEGYELYEVLRKKLRRNFI